MEFNTQPPQNAVAARQEIARPEGISDRDFIKYSSELLIQRSEIDVNEQRISRQEQLEFASRLRREAFELLGISVQG